ncbi:uncharacterized protein LOC131212251 [Anopheles bellator]|uniref:uncharacterized protein LOC131212251 n=1 Tax=Anopheles bellator TaxID=139047 RepID=UPI0026494276|nr:uncharacterized protein LOC131212251 [Anopheles bellator]
MDRSVDSIGSCSLDVDADSTDFSDTSGELNFLTPISGKDITREFTAGIKERCMVPVINCQAVTSVLDPVTGHISTVLTTTAAAASPVGAQQQQPLLSNGDSIAASQVNKKPSYLNLACCVNGYSNLTTYDSKLRQDINKSREVSPSRPIIATLHYNRTDSTGTGAGNHLLAAPTLSYVSMNNTINNNYGGTTGAGGQLGFVGSRMFKINGGGGGLGRVRAMNGTSAGGPVDVTDNAACALFNGNGTLRSKVISSQSQISSLSRDDPSKMTPKKSFIQQRVEKLYGASEGVVINKQIYSNSERKYLNNIANETNGVVVNGTTPATLGHSKGHLLAASGGGSLLKNGSAHLANGAHSVVVEENNKLIGSDEHQPGDDPDVEALPVLRHLRPEFRAQLQIFSPKKIPKPSPSRSLGATAATNGNVHHTNGTAMSHGSAVEESLYSRTQRHHATDEQHYSSIDTSYDSLRQDEDLSRMASTTTATSNGHHYHETSSHHSNAARTMHVVERHTDRATKSEEHTIPSPPASVVAVDNAPETIVVSANTASRATVPVDIAAVRHQQPATAASGSFDSTSTVPENKVHNGVDESAADSAKVADVENRCSQLVVNGGDVLNCDNPSAEMRAVVAQDPAGTGATTGASEEASAVKPVPPPVATTNGNSSAHSLNNNNNHELDGNYFLQILRNEQNRLQTMATSVEKEIQKLKANGVVLCEEIDGYTLVAVGKARLLCSQKMKQFEGLCYTNLNQTPGEKFQTTGEDLRGFWDMVMLQVNDVDATFAEIDTFRKNGWKKPVIKSPLPAARNGATRTTKLIKRPYKTATTNGATSSSSNVTDGETKKASAALAAAKREAQRKQLMEMKRKQKLAANGQQPLEIFTQTSSVASSSDGTAPLSPAANASTLVDTS